MADTLPSPPVSVTEHGAVQHDDVAQKLDNLFEQYLELLDQYTTLRQELSETFSAGFFTLAQAQRTSTLGAGRRYGPECYDQRMKAQRKLQIDQHDGAGTKYTVRKVQQAKGEGADEERPVNTGSGGASPKQEQTLKDSQGEQETTKQKRPKPDPAHRDPLTWFGILAPPALRQTQSHFVKAVEQSMPSLLSIESRMRALEADIWSCRQEMGVSFEKLDEQLDARGAKTQQMAEDTGPGMRINQKISQNSPRRTNIASRPAHAKSHLLKLGD